MKKSLTSTACNHSKGFTLSELAIVLAAMGLVMGSVWAISASVWESYRFRETLDQTMAVVQNVRTFFDPVGRILDPATQTAYANGVNITPMLDDDNHRLIPIQMRVDQSVAGGAINHALGTIAGGSFTVLSAGGGLRFRVRLSGLSQNSCVKMLMDFPILTPEIGVTEVNVNGTAHAVDPLNPANPGVGFPMTPVTAASWCNISATKTNVVSFVFRLQN